MFVKMRVHIRPNILRSCNNCQRLGGLTCLGPRSSKQFVQKQRFVKVYSQVRSDILTASEEEEQIAFAGIRKQVTQRIQKLGAQGKPREALNELLGMARQGVQPDTQAATALLSVCVQNGNLQMAENIFNQLFGEFVSPDPVTFSVLIQGYGQIDPPDWSSIASTLRNMESQFDLVPNVTVYNALLSVCVKSNDLQRAQDLLSQMDREGIQPDKTTEGTMSSRRAFRAALRKYL
eukprot:TRINITY_DN22544_c1_g1_i2.p1 TRINITY_DN22544_c1_g1~~TRINITY_DN22544_c1_g1_i2.p1  ORF type:complete len:234 (+),score=25.60 TRINITY_DN22544_c1_g1_i2:51-752(+)